MIEVKGYVEVKKKLTYITEPKFEDKHIQFFRKYFCKENLVINSLGNRTIIHDLFSLSQIQLFVNSFVYEFGKW